MHTMFRYMFISVVFLLFSFMPTYTFQLHCKSESEKDVGAETDLTEENRFQGDFDRSANHPFIFSEFEPLPSPERFDFFPDRLTRERGLLTHKSETAPTTYQLNRVMYQIIDDFLINSDTFGGSEQSYAAVARDAAGNFVIAWEDYRSGHSDIYFQRCDSSGNPLGSNFKVNDDNGSASQYNPAIAMDRSGNFVLTWIDGRNGNYDIYAQRYDSSGCALAYNFKVNDDTNFTKQVANAVAMTGSGSFAIVWQDYRNGNYDIYAQRYDSSGGSLGSNSKVNDDTGSAQQFWPDIAMDVSGNFAVTWLDYRDDYNEIYLQRYDSGGNPLGSNFKVNWTAGRIGKRYPAIAMDHSGNFVVTWQDHKPGMDHYSDVYAQRYDSQGNPIDSNLKVNDVSDSAYYYDILDIAMDSSGTFVITWTDSRNGSHDIYAQIYNSSGNPIGSNFKVNDDSGFFSQGEPSIATDPCGNFVILWQDYRLGTYDIYAQRYNSYGNSLGYNFKVSHDVATTHQHEPAIAVNGSKKFIVTWEDRRNGNADIYARRYDPSGNPLSSDFKVNDDAKSTDHFLPDIGMDASGNFVIIWTDTRNGNHDIYAQRYDSSGSPLDSNFKVNVNSNSTFQWVTAIAMDSSGAFVIAWEDDHNGDPDIYFQRYSSSGTPLDSNFKANDDAGSREQLFPDIAIHGSGDFVITWHDYRSGNPDIYGQSYNSSGQALGSNFKVNDDAGFASQYYPAVVMDDLGNFTITWQDYRNGKYAIYAQRYDPYGNPLGSNFKVSDDYGTDSQFYPNIASDSYGNFVIVWQDFRNGIFNSDIYAQRYDASGNPVGGNYLVPNTQYAFFHQEDPAVAANNSFIYFTWADNRRAKGLDVYAKIVDWNWTKVREEQETSHPDSFELSNNYPNPFNPTTTISFSLKAKASELSQPIHTTLTICNILGQKVRTLVNDKRLPGVYKVVWDGKDSSGHEVASGIYFYQLKTKNFISSKKMVLLR